MSNDTLKKGIFDANDTMEGFEDINGSTMSIPFIRVLQKLSPQLNKNKPEFIGEAAEGDVFNTTTKEVYGPNLAVVVLKFEHVFIEWKPNRGGFVSYHTPENAERLAVDKTFGKWKTKDGNDLVENYVYLLLIEGHESEGPVVLSLSSSMIKLAREWNRLMTTHIMDDGSRARPYYLVWKLTTKYNENDKGTWYSFDVAFSRYIDERVYAITKQERVALPSRKVDYAALEDKTNIESTEY